MFAKYLIKHLHFIFLFVKRDDYFYVYITKKLQDTNCQDLKATMKTKTFTLQSLQ